MTRKGDRLDDLVFAYRMLRGKPSALEFLDPLLDEIQALSREIYKKACDADLLWNAWKLRFLNPLLLPQAADNHWQGLVGDAIEEIKKIRDAYKRNPDAVEIFHLYHTEYVIKRSREFEEYKTEVLNAAMLRMLQEEVLKEILNRRLVLETLPTSNVRISFYHDFSEHHIFRWLGLTEHQHQPQVCVGSDDPGIFSCSLRGEFMHLYREVRKRVGSDREAMARIEHLNETGRVYRFL